MVQNVHYYLFFFVSIEMIGAKLNAHEANLENRRAKPVPSGRSLAHLVINGHIAIYWTKSDFVS